MGWAPGDGLGVDPTLVRRAGPGCLVLLLIVGAAVVLILVSP